MIDRASFNPPWPAFYKHSPEYAGTDAGTFVLGPGRYGAHNIHETVPVRHANTGALRGVTMDDVREKFRDCASLLLSKAITTEILSLLDSLEEGTPITSLTDLLHA